MIELTERCVPKERWLVICNVENGYIMRARHYRACASPEHGPGEHFHPYEKHFVYATLSECIGAVNQYLTADVEALTTRP